MTEKKAVKNSPAVCVVRCKHMGDASVFMFTLPRVHKQDFREAFEETFKNVDMEKDSNKIKAGLYCDTDSGKGVYATAILIIPPVFPSKMQKLLQEFCLKHGLQLNPYIPDPDQK